MDSGRLKSRGLWEVYSGVVLLVTLLFRAHNLPTLACCLLIQTVMAQFIWKKLHYDAAQTTIMHYWFGQAFFYFQVMMREHLRMALFSEDSTGLVSSINSYRLNNCSSIVLRMFSHVGVDRLA